MTSKKSPIRLSSASVVNKRTFKAIQREAREMNRHLHKEVRSIFRDELIKLRNSIQESETNGSFMANYTPSSNVSRRVSEVLASKLLARLHKSGYHVATFVDTWGYTGLCVSWEDRSEDRLDQLEDSFSWEDRLEDRTS